ncbi:MCE family protein [Amycolatopsis sp. K13G38]|uniref:MCE family protein n=1 Tax=Amycolatopsis acididurans TaxID=2724524 RepID=A0ABX1JD85_9PSEU|nr:MCE family protein [Amycolatopsis acididurans]NKQ56227.1 MCE family protein [Amycolatopsis acididurans]
MSIETKAQRGAYRWLATACVAALVLTAGIWLLVRDQGGTGISALFDKTVGLYSGSSVRVLGVQVGQVTNVTPQGTRVRVEMQLDAGVRVPATAQAVVVAPSLVSDRYVQLTPAYKTGPVMAAGTVIPRDRTATPMELDDLYGSLDKLSTALGPSGANAHGSLSNLLDTAANNLDGNGKNINNTLSEIGDLSQTLNESKGDLFATIGNLQSFTTTLADSDQQINQFYQRLADVTGFLAGDSRDIGGALSSLASALGEVRQFVEQNRDGLTSNVDKLASLTQVLVDERAALAETLDVGPAGLDNYINSYDAASGSIAIRYDANELTNPLFTTLCRLLKQATPAELPDVVGKVCQALEPVAGGAPSVTQILAGIASGKLPPLPLVPLVSIPEAGR